MRSTGKAEAGSRRAAAGRWLAGVALAAAVAMPAQGSDPPERAMATAPAAVLVQAIAGWVAADLGLPMPEAMPRIVLVRPEAMRRSHARSAEAEGFHPGARDLVAFYDTRRRTIYLPASWRPDDPTQVSILVHEMVHHLQTEAGERYACPGAREKPAYEAQRRWLERFDLTLEQAIGIDPLMLLVATNCLF